MEIRELAVQGAWEITPELIGDSRGLFTEWYKADVLEDAVGHRLSLQQANLSVSTRGTVRGVHFADVPPSQAKYVACPRGALLDVIVDLRVGSPTFGVVDAVRLDDVERKAVYLAEGLGHAFLALEDGTTINYLCSTGYWPTREHGVTPLDPALGLTDLAAWPAEMIGDALTLSPRDLAAPTLAQAQEQGLLPSYEACLAFYAELAGG